MTQHPKPTFKGFDHSPSQFIPIPDALFTQILPLIEDPDQLKLLLCLFRIFEHQEAKSGYFQSEEIFSDPLIIQILDNRESIRRALDGLIKENVLLSAETQRTENQLYFFNTPQGAAAVEAISNGQWRFEGELLAARQIQPDQPNIYKLYEENIGAITPMMAEILKDDEKTYPNSWIEDAIRIAVTRNARNWKYVQAILDRWQKEGRGNEQNRRDNSQDPDSYRESWLKHK
jgi:DnaD/phage-associated family protein